MTENSTVTVGLEVTETYEQSFDRARLLDVAEPLRHGVHPGSSRRVGAADALDR